MPTTLRLLLLLMLGLFGLQVSYGYDAPGGFVSGTQNIVAASPESHAATVESAATVPLNFSREGGATDKQAETHAISDFVAAESEMTTVLGSKADVAPFVGKPGFNTFTGEGIPAAELDRANAQWLNQAIQRGDNIFANADPIGFGGGMNWYAYADGNPISNTDPFGLGPFGYDTWGDYGHEVGQVFVGYGQAVGDTASGLYNTVRHPVNTATGLYNVAAHPINAYNAISQSVANTWNSGSAGQGRIVGNILIAGATFGAAKATSIAGNAGQLGDLITVSRWGRAGLASGDWVMEGGATMKNYVLSGKWDPLPWNEVAPFENGQTFTVPSGSLYPPRGLNPLDGRLKSLVPGQMQYYPEGAGLITPGEAGALVGGAAAGGLK